MKLSALKQRAREARVEEERLAEADDAEDMKGAVIELIVEAMRAASARAVGDATVADAEREEHSCKSCDTSWER
eukprot:SAG11_NODE_39_length_21630_cov_11.188658_10_plen_74_part_00